MDDTDRHLIELLATDSRAALKELARAVGLSSPSVSERIRKLEDRGEVRRYTIDVNPETLGYPVQAVVRIRPLPGRQQIVQKLIEKSPEIAECDKVTGEDCYIIRLFATSLDHLDRIVDRIAQSAETNTMIVKSQPVRRRPPPPPAGHQATLIATARRKDTMPRPQLFHIDAFTRTLFKGNPAGVVLNADTLSATEMQNIARELKHSETAFMLAPQGGDHDVYLRYFTPTTEVPICGHATVAAHYARAMALGLDASRVRQKTGAGIQTIDVNPHEGDYRITMQQGRISFGSPMGPELREDIARGLGFMREHLDPSLPVQTVSTGHAKVLVPLLPDAPLDAAVPDAIALTRISSRIGCTGFFPFVIRPDGASTEGRMFAPAIGILEDPVTGNANGPLGAYLVRHRLMPHDPGQLMFEGHQGRTLGRDGIVHVSVEVSDGQPTRVSIHGDAVLLFTAPLSGWGDGRPG